MDHFDISKKNRLETIYIGAVSVIILVAITAVLTLLVRLVC